jgi:hypothetical protein
MRQRIRFAATLTVALAAGLIGPGRSLLAGERPGKQIRQPFSLAAYHQEIGEQGFAATATPAAPVLGHVADAPEPLAEPDSGLLPSLYPGENAVGSGTENASHDVDPLTSGPAEVWLPYGQSDSALSGLGSTYCACGKSECTSHDTGCDATGNAGTGHGACHGACASRQRCGGTGGGRACGLGIIHQQLDCSLNLCCPDPCSRWWVQKDLLLWWVKGDNVPALVSSSPAGTPLTDVGVLGLPATTTLFGGPLADGMRVGSRLSVGYALDDCGTHSVVGSFWGLQNLTDDYRLSSTGNPALARPFFNVDRTVNAEDAELVAYDGLLNGTVSANMSSELYSGNLGIRHRLKCCGDNCQDSSRRVDLFTGYRFMRVNEGIRINEALESTALSGPVAAGTTINLFDRFRTRNEFHGGELGVAFTRQEGRWFSDLLTSVAFGNLNRTVIIDGATTVTVPTVAPVTTSGGLLTQATNIGTHRDSEFAVLPQFQASLGYQLNCRLRCWAGYSFAYLSDVVRLSDAIDRRVNGTFLDATVPDTGPNRPAYRWSSSDLWVMGANMGLEWKF